MQIGSHNVQNIIVVYPDGPAAPQTPGVGRTVHNLPRASAVFLGRDLQVLADQLSDDAGVAVGRVIAVHGLGGIGKSELANHYARAYLTRYSLVWWVTADSVENLELGLTALTRRLHPVATLTDAQGWAMGWLQANSGWLLVLDNVEDVTHIADLLGVVAAQGQVLVTTRRDLGTARWTVLGFTPFRLSALTRAASVRLLTRLTGRSDDAGADRLAADLGDLPLALEQAAAYVSQHESMSFDDYRDLLAGRFVRVAGSSGFGGRDSGAVATVWTLTMAAIADASPLTSSVMDVLAWLAPDDLPDDVLGGLSDDPFDIDDALALLASYCMISRNGGTVSVHRLVQAVTRNSQEIAETDEIVQRQAVRLLIEAIPNDPINDIRDWPRWAALLPHGDALFAHVSDDHRNPDVPRLGARFATYRQHQGQTGKAIAQFESVLADRCRLLGGDHPDTLASRHSLAFAYLAAGRLDAAITALEGVVADRRRLLGDDHPDTLTSRHHLAFAYREAGRSDEAITAFESVLADARHVLGEHHPDTLAVRHDCAGAYQSAGRFTEAAAMLEGVLADRCRLLGGVHPDTLATRNNLFLVYREVARLDEAVTGFVGLLADARLVLGESHPNTLAVRSNLAGAYQAVGRLDEAIAVSERVLVDARQVFGDHHPNTYKARHGLAATYQAAGRFDEAIAAFKAVLDDRRRLLGTSHPHTLRSRRSLAAAYREAEGLPPVEGVLE
ncbi:tetratricopeptide repeat protein [Actinoplanes sichuanensis]|uniref:tetratricopeptide repeat protein n=1 Tax=Actinoplanes sichuanensis TaxID=512349 RepID=UPI00295407BA|nr:tetratricopeptide repeat protein [Actinoplanes sichuanensis]